MNERVFIGLGSNIGDRAATIDRAVDALECVPSCKVLQLSSLWETEPVGPPQPKYLNAVAEIATGLAPADLLATMLEIERFLGRVRSAHERNAPRTIDLDLLLYGQRILTQEHLEIPHPRLTQRPFVLIPLLEIAPQLRHPLTGEVLLSFPCAQGANDGVAMWRIRTVPSVT